MTDSSGATAGHVDASALYSLGVAQKHMGWGIAALRSARRKGLKVRYFSGRGYVSGAELIRFITEVGKTTK